MLRISFESAELAQRRLCACSPRWDASAGFIYLTHHQHLAELAKTARPEARVHEVAEPWNPLAQFELWTISAATKERAMVGNHQKSRWSANVTAHSDALDLEPKVFEKESAGEIAASLKRSAESSDRRKTSAFRSAMSMLTFYINRAGRNLPNERKHILEAAKEKLRGLFGRNH